MGTTGEELGVLGRVANELVLLGERWGRVRQQQAELVGIDMREGVSEQLLGEIAHRLVGGQAARQRQRHRLLDDGGWIARGQPDDAPHALVPFAPAPLEQMLAQGVSLGADVLGAREDLVGLARGVEHALHIGQLHLALACGQRMAPDQLQGAQIADLDFVRVDAHQHLIADARRTCGVVGVIDLDGGVVLHAARGFGEIAKALQGQGFQMRTFFLEHLLDLALGAAVDAGGSPVLLPLHEIGVLFFQRFEAPTLERGGLGMLDRVLDGAFAIGVGYARRVGHYVIVREHRGIDAIELGFIDVGGDHALQKVIEDAVLGAAAEIAKRFLVQACPDFAARLPHHFAKRAPRIAQRHHKQTWLTVATRGMARGCALAVIDLRFLAGQELEPIELLGLAPAQRPAEALDAVVARREAEAVDQFLVDRGGIAAQAHLRLDPVPMRFAAGARVRRRAWRQRRSRWPGWGSLPRLCRRVGGRGGGIWLRGCAHRPFQIPDGLAIHPGAAMDLVLRGANGQQRGYGGLQMRLQDIHLLPPLHECKRGR